MDFTIKPLTPIFTGGLEGKCDRLHETGIIGSMRWWFEAIIRGMGGYACDPTEHNSSCPVEKKVNGKEVKCYCDACVVFGTTGLKRAFNLQLDSQKNVNKDSRLDVKIKNNPNRGWYLNQGIEEEISGSFLIPAYSASNTNITATELRELLIIALFLASEWGGLGAKSQQGYGSALLDQSIADFSQIHEIMEKLLERQDRRYIQGTNRLPRLDQFFFRKVRFDKSKYNNEHLERIIHISGNNNSNILPIAPLVRYHLRALIRESILFGYTDNDGNQHKRSNAAARWRLMGVMNGDYHKRDFGKVVGAWYCNKCNGQWTEKPTKSQHSNCDGKPIIKWKCTTCEKEWTFDPTKKNRTNASEAQKIGRQKSLINVSHAYLKDDQWELRIWGWVPPEFIGRVQRETVIDLLQQWTTSGGELWKRCGLEPLKHFGCWVDMLEGDISDNIKSLVAVKGGESK